MKNKKDILILAGGYGSRLYPITLFIPKIFLTYKSKYLLDHHIASFENYKNSKIYINLLSRGFFKKFIKKYSLNKKIEFIIEKKPTGTAGILKKILKKKNNSDLILVYSDTFHENTQKKIIENIIKMSEGKNITISASNTKEKINDKGIIFMEKHTLKKFIEKPKKPYNSTLYFSGLVFIPNHLKNSVLRLISQNSRQEILDFSKLILMSGNFTIKVYRTTKEPLDFGKWSKVIKNYFKC